MFKEQVREQALLQEQVRLQAQALPQEQAQALPREQAQALPQEQVQELLPVLLSFRKRLRRVPTKKQG
jgi:patatin-like phospholipase/acyl hydrolase